MPLMLVENARFPRTSRMRLCLAIFNLVTLKMVATAPSTPVTSSLSSSAHCAAHAVFQYSKVPQIPTCFDNFTNSSNTTTTSTTTTSTTTQGYVCEDSDSCPMLAGCQCQDQCWTSSLVGPILRGACQKSCGLCNVT